jgi:pyridoxamine 5'-phosphate oxidase
MDLYKEALAVFTDLFAQAQRSEPSYPEAMALATVDAQARPHVRTVLLKEFDERGFVFYTNKTSAKAQQLDAHAFAALSFHWKSLKRQVQIEGGVTLVSDAEADAYFASRPRVSQIGAWASLQSQKLDSRQTLLDRVQEFENKYQGRTIPRPSHWSGYRVAPHRIEFWKDEEFRLHQRTIYELGATGWTKFLVYP